MRLGLSARSKYYQRQLLLLAVLLLVTKDDPSCKCRSSSSSNSSEEASINESSRFASLVVKDDGDTGETVLGVGFGNGDDFHG